jgi:hypothetical protein
METTAEPQVSTTTARRESVPRPDYEFTECYARTPTHIFAVRGGKPWVHGNELCRMPLDDIAKQEKIPLPGKFDEIAICGLTERWLFVSIGQAPLGEHDSYPKLQSATTYRLSLDTLKPEKIDEGKMNQYPRYNAASNSLLSIRDKTVEALNLDTGKRSEIYNFSAYYNPDNDAHIRGWANTPDGPSLEILGNWWDGPFYCIVFDGGNTGRMMDRADVPGWYEPQPENSVGDHITCGEYVYYVQATDEQIDVYRYVNNLYRMKIDGSDVKLLRAKTNIFSMMAVNGKLCCMAWLPNHEDDAFGFYALGEDGKVVKTIDTGWLGEWADYDWGRLGDLIMFYFDASSYAENAISCLYDPATGATFYAYEKEGDAP